MCNMGKTDKIIRAIVGLALLAAAYLTPYWWLAIIGVIALGTALLTFCPMYAILGINTSCEVKHEESKDEE